MSDDQSVLERPLAHTIEDAARRSTICRTSVYAAIKSGDLKARKAGKRTLILDEDLHTWLAALPIAQRAPAPPNIRRLSSGRSLEPCPSK
jgi:excisionase family DNA binding protein